MTHSKTQYIRFKKDLERDFEEGYFARAGQYGVVSHELECGLNEYTHSVKLVGSSEFFYVTADEFEFVKEVPKDAPMGIRAINVNIKFPNGPTRDVEIVVDAALWDNANHAEREEIVVDSVNAVISYTYSEK